MARPSKQTVDYFPHEAKASSGDTITALEGQFGNDGYAFWFKLLEHLASSEGHYIDCSNPKKWQLILARSHVSHSTGTEIMKLLVEMNAIDPDLWSQGIIWCQNLVNNVALVYQNRRRPLPLRPVPFLQPITPLLQVTTSDNSITTGDNLITTLDNPQSKVKESIVNNIKEEKTIEDVKSLYQEKILLGGGIPEDIEKDITITCAKFPIDSVYDAIIDARRTNRYANWRQITNLLKDRTREFGEGQ